VIKTELIEFQDFSELLEAFQKLCVLVDGLNDRLYRLENGKSDISTESDETQATPNS
jgi:hypothetical protein